jgi:Rrf2 family protein
MKLTRATDYAVRLLTYLAANGLEGKSIEIAKELNIPFNHLAKLVHTLGRQGYLFNRKGKAGGIRLAVDPKKTSLIEIIEAMEGPLALNDCLQSKDNCENSANCRFRRHLARIQEAMRESLGKSTISDLVPQNRRG